MRGFLAGVMVISAYVVIYYRLLVRHYYEKQSGVKESNFGAIFSFPPYQALPDAGKKYARRYWVAVSVMVLCVVTLAVLTDFSVWRHFSSGP